MEEEILFQPGDVIVPASSGPFAKMLLDKGGCCDHCLTHFEDGQSRPCKGGCLRMHYCGEDCAKEDWEEGHSIECSSVVFRSFRGGTLGGFLDGVLRMLAKLHLKPDSFAEKRTVAGAPHRSINDLLADVDSGAAPPPEVSQLFKELKGDPSFTNLELDEELLWKMCQVWKYNSFPLVNIMVEMVHVSLGMGLYTGKPAGAKHSCRPNAVRIGFLDKVELRCIHPIRKGEEPTISYLLQNHNLPMRQFILKHKYDCSCDCDLCTLELSSGPLVDYEKFTELPNKLYGEEIRNRYQSMLGIRDEVMALYRKVYHEYDKRIAMFCYFLFEKLCELHEGKKGDVPMPVLQREAEDLEQRLRVTFGKDSFVYSNLMRKLERRGIKEEEIMFQPGDVIVSKCPLPFVKTVNLKGKLCDNCLTPGASLSRCTGCRMMFYCGAACQKKDWKEGHSVECKSEVFKKENRFAGVAVLRILAKFKTKPSSFSKKHSSPAGDGVPERSFNDRLSDEEAERELREKPIPSEIFELFTALQKDSSYGKKVKFDKIFLWKMMLVWSNHAIPLAHGLKSELPPVGWGLYVFNPAFFKHACRPNAVRVGFLDTMEVRCIHPIKKGEEPKVSYLRVNLRLQERQGVLKTYIKATPPCDCALCLEEINSGPAIDYGKMELLEEKLVMTRCGEMETDYSALIELRDEILALYRKLYHEYDFRITSFALAIFEVLCCQKQAFGNVPNAVLEKEWEGLEKLIGITFGKDSACYSNMMMRLWEVGIPLGGGAEGDNQ